MIITLTGPNDFAAKQALSDLVATFVDQYGPHGLERVDAETFSVQNLPSLLQGASLFTPQRLVVLRGAAQNKPLWEALGDMAPKVPADTTLVVVEPAPDKRTKTYKALKAGGDFKEFALPSGAELTQWAQAHAKQLGAKLAPTDARYLVERVAHDQWRLGHELAKLAHFTPTITRPVIDQLVEPSPEGSAFELLDAALAGDSQKVTNMVAALRQQEDPYRLFGLLASQVHTLALAATAGTRSADAIAKDAGAHPFVVRKTQGVAKKLGQKRIKHIVEHVAICDMQLKSTGVEPWQLLHLCLAKIATEGTV